MVVPTGTRSFPPLQVQVGTKCFDFFSVPMLSMTLEVEVEVGCTLINVTTQSQGNGNRSLLSCDKKIT